MACINQLLAMIAHLAVQSSTQALFTENAILFIDTSTIYLIQQSTLANTEVTFMCIMWPIILNI